MLRQLQSPFPLPDDLTPREADALRAIAAGRTNAEIASELSISAVTVTDDHGLVTPRS
jgi:DNA-binding NarL/FixJ family response regulator